MRQSLRQARATRKLLPPSYPIMRDISALVRKWTDRLTRIGYNFLIGDTKKYKAFPWLAISNMDEQKLTVCEEMMKIQIAFFEKLGMQKIADHCVRIMEDYRKGIGKQKESDCR